MDTSTTRSDPGPANGPARGSAGGPATAPWALTGVVAGVTGLATSYLVAMLMHERLTPVTAVAEGVIRISPSWFVEWAKEAVGTNDKPILVGVILVLLVAIFSTIGVLTRRRWWASSVGFGLLTVVAAVATLTARGTAVYDLAPLVVGFITQMAAITVLSEQLRGLETSMDDAVRDGLDPAWAAARNRRGFLIGVGAVVGIAAVSGLIGRVAGGARSKVEEARRLLRLQVTAPKVPAGAVVGVEGTYPWMTPADSFYLIDTAIVRPTILPQDWRLRIHGMVENEIELTYDDLVAREMTESWVTLNCVSNYVGGDLVGNAWWSGVRLDDLLAEAKPLDGADAVLQTSDDGWTCGTPLTAMTDGRDAMLALAMNGEPLTIEHGFPVRTLVPGLYGYVSATKWVVDMEVTRFTDFSAFWTDRGWGEMGPVKMASRIEVPLGGDDVDAGSVTFAGTAWSQHTGISAVEVALDGGAWQPAELGTVPNDDTWVQWRVALEVDPGDHAIKVRATDSDGLVQTGEVRDVLPDGATGWHEIDFTAR